MDISGRIARILFASSTPVMNWRSPVLAERMASKTTGSVLMKVAKPLVRHS